MQTSDLPLPAVAVRHSPRREALRRLALIGVAACASGSLLSGCGTSAPPPAATSAPVSSAPVPTDLPGRDPDTPTGSDVTFTGPSGQLRGSWAAPVGKAKGAVLVVPDSQGMTPHLADVVGRFAGAGYAALSVDLLSGQSGAPTDPSQAAMALASLPPATLLADMRAGVVELGKRAPGAKIGAVGFGFGAGALWQLLGAGDPILAAAVPFYGQTPDDVNFAKSHAAVLALYPEIDRKLGESQDNADQAMMDANLVHNSMVFKDADTGFFDDTGTRYNADAASKAWTATLDWFNRYLVSAPSAPQALPAKAKAPGAHPAKPAASKTPKTP